MSIKQIITTLVASAITTFVFTSCDRKAEETVSVTSVTVSPDRVEIIEGESAKLTAKISPSAASGKTVTWTSSDQSVATVDGSGNVAGLAAGSATVTATVEGHNAMCQVTVKKRQSTDPKPDPDPEPEPDYVEKERQALIAFYKANNGDSWEYKDNWCGSKPVSDWYGVAMTADGKRVRSIVLNGSEVYGRIPDEIVDLEMLEELRITNYGEEPEQSYPLPEAIGKQKYLKKLYFQRYPTGGRLPEAIFDLANLDELRLKLTEAQPMPASIAKLTRLKMLDLGGSKLTGSLIPELWNLHELTELELWGCGLTGSIPTELGGLTNLKTIDLSANKLSGVIPIEVSRLENFWNLWTGIVFGNNFTQKDIEDSHLPAPKSFQTIALDGSTIDLEQEFGKNRYTVLMHVNPKSGNAQSFIERLSTFYDKNKDKGLGVITYFDNNDPKDKNANVADFKNILSTFHVCWKSFASWMYKDGQREFYTERGKSMYPHGSENSVVIIGPDRTVAYTTLPDKSSDKLDNVLSYLSNVFGSKEEYYESKDYSADGKVITLQKATVGNGADIVITGDAFSDRLIADCTLRKMADDAVNGIFSMEPLKSLKDRFNVYLVNAVSKNEEYTNTTSTAFNGTFGNGSACGGDLDKVLEYSKKAVGASRMNDVTVLVLMNSYRSAGTTYMLKPSFAAGYGKGASIAFLPYKNWNSTGYSKEDLTATLIHELVGHGIGKLDDEYSYSSLGRIPQDEIDYIKENKEKYGWYQNTDFTSDPDKVK